MKQMIQRMPHKARYYPIPRPPVPPALPAPTIVYIYVPVPTPAPVPVPVVVPPAPIPAPGPVAVVAPINPIIVHDVIPPAPVDVTDIEPVTMHIDMPVSVQEIIPVERKLSAESEEQARILESLINNQEPQEVELSPHAANLLPAFESLQEVDLSSPVSTAPSRSPSPTPSVSELTDGIAPIMVIAPVVNATAAAPATDSQTNFQNLLAYFGGSPAQNKKPM